MSSYFAQDYHLIKTARKIAMKNIIDRIEINPTTKARGTVIWLHGLGASGDDFVPVGKQLNMENLNLKFIFPHAPMQPVTINGGYVMRAWYDIIAMFFDGHADESGMQQAVAQIHQLIAEEEQKGTASEKILLAGFSQGAVISLLAGLTYSKKLAGILALSGYLPHPEPTVAKTTLANQQTPVFLGHGTGDTVVPCFLGEKVFNALKNNDHPVEWHQYLMAHSVCLEEIQDITEWLKKIF